MYYDSFFFFWQCCTKDWLRKYNKNSLPVLSFDYICSSSFTPKGSFKTHHGLTKFAKKWFSWRGNFILKHGLSERTRGISFQWVEKERKLPPLWQNCTRRERRFAFSGAAEQHLVQVGGIFEKFCYLCGQERHQLNRTKGLSYSYISLSSCEFEMWFNRGVVKGTLWNRRLLLTGSFWKKKKNFLCPVLSTFISTDNGPEACNCISHIADEQLSNQNR